MNQFKQLLLLFVSISGLISCSPDKDENQNIQNEDTYLKSQAIEQILIKQSDRSFKVLQKGLGSIQVGSQLKLVYKEGVSPSGTMRTDVTCHTPQRQAALNKTTSLEMENLNNDISLLNILPPEVLAPVSNEMRINCDLNLEIIEKNILTVSIGIENISLENTNNFSNWDILSGVSEEKRQSDYLFRTSEFDEISLKFQKNEMNTIHTVCEKTQIESFNVEEISSLSKFFEKSLFESHPISMCRLIAINDKDQSVKVSQVLNVEGLWSQVRMLWDTRLKKTNNPLSINSEAMLIKIENNGTGTARINFKVHPNQNIKVRPHYGNPLPSGKIWFFPELSISAEWIQVSTGESLYGDNVIEIPPNSFENFELRPLNNLKCPIGERNYQTNPCNHSLYLGASTKVSVPTITVETQKNRTEKQWQLLSKKIKQASSNNQISEWLPSATLNKTCTRFPTVINTPAHQGPVWRDSFEDCVVD